VHITAHLFRDPFVNRLRCIRAMQASSAVSNQTATATPERSRTPWRMGARSVRLIALTPTSGLECARPHRQLQNLILQQSNEPAREP
jgi:hypothetical protein